MRVRSIHSVSPLWQAISNDDQAARPVSKVPVQDEISEQAVQKVSPVFLSDERLADFRRLTGGTGAPSSLAGSKLKTLFFA